VVDFILVILPRIFAIVDLTFLWSEKAVHAVVSLCYQAVFQVVDGWCYGQLLVASDSERENLLSSEPKATTSFLSRKMDN
jgi:hypothetical protein